MTPTRESLDQLISKAAKLNEETDQLNNLFLALQEKLKQGKIGVTAWLQDLIEREAGHDEVGNAFDEGWVIGYAKVDNEWCLAARREEWRYSMVGEEKEYTDEDGYVTVDPIQLVRAPRSVRAEAAGKLDDLVNELTRQVDRYLENIERAKSTAAISSGSTQPAEKKKPITAVVTTEPPAKRVSDVAAGAMKKFDAVKKSLGLTDEMIAKADAAFAAIGREQSVPSDYDAIIKTLGLSDEMIAKADAAFAKVANAQPQASQRPSKK